MSENKELMINKLFRILQEQGEQLQGIGNMDPHAKADELDVLLDVMHFLQDYDENVKILNEYWIKRKQREKFKNLSQGPEL